MNTRFIILIMTFIFISSCDKDDLELYNCQDINNNCYLEPLENFGVFSYSPSEIILDIDNPDEIEFINVERISIDNPSGVSIIIHKDENDLFIDSADIHINQTYTYSVRNSSDFGVSDLSEDILLHDFPPIDKNLLIIKPRNETAIDIDWSYDLDEVFMKEYDEASWTIIKSKKTQICDENGENCEYPSNWSEEEEFYLFQDSSNNEYSYEDDENIDLYDSLKYLIYLELDGFQSDTITRDLKVNFPQMEFVNWTPINSTTISLHWKIDDSNNDNITSVRITNDWYQSQYGNDEYMYEIGAEQIEDILIDDLSDYFNGPVDPYTNVEYTIEWCGVSDCLSETFDARTFQFKNMQYIPAMSNVDFNENNTVSTDAFYIDIYEVNEFLYDNPGDNNHVVTGELPKSEISFNEADNWCDTRTNDNLNLILLEPSLEDFRLPTGSEWYVAAAIQYDILSNQVQQQYDYTTQVGNGTITCAFGNTLNCFNEALTVGYYNGNNLPNYQKSTSPNGLYDCNANVKEWVDKSNQFSHSESGDVIMSGDFQSSEVNAKNNHFI